MALPETTQGWIERYEKREDRAYRNYQETGDIKYDRQQYEYSKIANAFRALNRKENEYHEQVQKRTKNCKYVIDLLRKDSYTREEVTELLQNAIYW